MQEGPSPTTALSETEEPEAPSPTTAPSGTPTAPSKTEQAPSETTTNATAILASLPQDDATQAVVADAVAKATKALTRATDMRNAGDPEHARMMDAVAVEWALVAVDLVNARKAETLLTKIQRKLFDLKEKIDRARLLLEETHARKARAAQQLDDLKQPAADATSAPAPAPKKGGTP